MKIFLLIITILFFLGKSFAQYGSAPTGTTWTPYVLNHDATRWTDWSNAGRQGGIPTSFSYFVSINDAKYTGTFTQKLIAAIQNAHDFGVDHNTIVAVKIPAGNYTIIQTITLPSNVVIKGAGSDQTRITFQTGNPGNDCFFIPGNYESNFYDVTSGNTMGSTQITLESADYFSENDFVDIRDSRNNAWENGSLLEYAIGQVVQIQSKIGNQLTLKDKLSIDHSGFNTRIYKISPVKDVGIEDLYIARSLSDGAGNGVTIRFYGAVNCWVKGCELENTSSMHIRMEYSSHITIKGNFIHHAQDYGNGGRGYGVALYYRSTNCLVEDNLLNFLRHALLLSTSSNRNVIAYNYSWVRNATGNNGYDNTIGDLSLHGNFAHRNLFESNSVENIIADDNLGDEVGWSTTKLTENGPYNVFLRNHPREEELSLYACENTTVIGADAVIDDDPWYVPLIIDYRGSTGTDGFFTEYVQDCENQSFITYEYWLANYEWVHASDFFPDISYYLTEQKMRDLFSTTSVPNYAGAVYGPTYGWFRESDCNYLWFEPRVSPAEYRKDFSKKTLNGGVVGSNNINNPISIYLKQLDNSGGSFGQASYWDNNLWNEASPTQQVTIDYQQQHFLSSQDFKPSTYEKFNYWQELPNNLYRYRNWDTLSLKSNSTQVRSQFKPTGNAVVYNAIENSASINVANVQFKDPWFVNMSEQPYGLRSAGLDALPICFSSPLNITQSSNYKGVFLNQGYNPVTHIWTPPYYTVKVDPVQDINLNSTGTPTPTGRTHKFYFQNWSGTNATFKNEYNSETPVVFTSNGATIKPYLKGTQLTLTQFTDKRSGQRGFIKDNMNGYLHNVYESYGQIFYERSTDNGASWALMNNGKPLNTSGLAKSPSICINDGRYLLYIVYQNDDFLNYGLVVTQYSLAQNANTSNWSRSICSMEDFNNSNDYQPVIASLSTMCVVVCNPPSTSAGLRAFNIYTNSSNNSYQSCSEFSLPNVDQNSSNPSIVASGSRFHLVYEQSQTSIRYYAWSGGEAVSSVVSSGSSTIFNLKPVISLLYGQCPIVSWIGATYNYSGGYYPTNVLTRVGSSLGSFTGAINSVSGQAQVVSNASNVLPQQKTLITWSYYSGSSYQSKWQRRDNTSTPTYTAPASMMNGAFYIHGIWTQAVTDVNFLSPNALVFNNGYTKYFISSTTNFAGGVVADDRTDGRIDGNGNNNVFLGKITEEDTIITFGRSGVASINDIEFVFEIGDIVVGDSIIRFIEIPDTITYSSATEINQHTRTNNFILSPQTNFYFSNIYFVVQKSVPDTALMNNNAVNFRVELVNSLTNQVVGTFDNITYNKNNLEKFANIDYSVDCSGIASGEYYLRLVTNVIGIANYTLANIFNDNTTLAKKNFNKVNFMGNEIPITYELSNNFPNPFNPSTTIRYQIPQDGIVTLKIYDILGSEVATLVNEEKVAGKYEVNFNASSLASGVYIYKIQSGSFVNSKKMILLK